MTILYIVLGIYLATTLIFAFVTTYCALTIATRGDLNPSASAYVFTFILIFFPCLFLCLIPFYRWKHLLNMMTIVKVEGS